MAKSLHTVLRGINVFYITYTGRNMMPGERWTQAEIDSLIHQVVGERKPLPQLSIAGKSAAALNNQRRRLKQAGLLNGAFLGRPVRGWTIPELKQLTALTTEYGFSAAFIAQLQLLPGR